MSSESPRRRADFGVSVMLTKIATYPVSIACSLLSATIALSSGLHAYSMYALVLSILTLLPAIDLGMGATLIKAAAIARSSPGDWQHFRRVLTTTFRTLTGSSLTLMVVSTVLYFTGLLARMLGGATALDSLGCYIAILLLACGLPLTLGFRLLVAAGRTQFWFLVDTMRNPLGLACLSAIWLLDLPWAYCTGPLLAQLIVLSVALRTGLSSFGLRAHELVVEAVRLRRVRGAPVRAHAVPVFVVMLAEPLALNSDRLLISHLGDNTALATYSLAAQLFVPVVGLSAAASLALWPIFARARHEDKQAGFGSSMSIILVFAVLGCLAIVSLGPWMASIVSQHQVDLPRSLLLATAAAAVAVSGQLGLSSYLTHPQELRVLAVAAVIMLAANVTLSVILFAALGVAGPAWATFTAVASCQILPGLVLLRRRRTIRAGGAIAASAGLEAESGASRRT